MMSKGILNLTLFLVLLSAIAIPVRGPSTVLGADHSDAPALAAAKRDDARLTDFHAFVVGGRLVLSECLNPTTPPTLTKYLFASDLIVQINIDNDSEVLFNDPNDVKTYGGTVVHPDQIKEDIVFTITFNDKGETQLAVKGIPDAALPNIRFFAGLRDDPFLLASWDGKNTAALVIELPLNLVLKSQSTLLLWGTSKVPGMDGPFQDLDARALRSQSNNALNSLHPSQHMKMLGVPPDVMIYDTGHGAQFPNGRALEDDVVALSRGNPPPYRKNDVPFLTDFPYLAPPQYK